MANFEETVMVALYWGGEIISEMSKFRYNEGARMIVSMSISTSYVELVAMLHEEMKTNSENIQMDISGKYPCSFQAQNYGFAMLSHPHFAYTATPSIHQSLDASPNEHEYQSYDEGLSSQGHIESGHRQYEIREDEDNFDLCNDAHSQICDESSKEDEPSEDDGESEILESESDEDTNDSEDLPQNDIGGNLHNQFGQSVSKMQNHDIPYFTTLENEEDIFISTREAEMNCCSVWYDDGKKEMCFSSKDRLKRAVTIWSLCKNKEFIVVTASKKLWIVRCRNLSDLMWNAASAHQVRKFKALMWEIREENEEAYEYLMQFPLDKWTISHDDGKRWGVLTTNLSESFNGLLKKARGLPVITMVRLSLEQIVERYTRRSQTTLQLVEQKELWTSRFKVKWEKNYESSKRHFVFNWNISTGTYEVRSIQVDGTGGNPHRVSVNDKKCDCGKWANLHFPCSHVMKVTERMGGLARNFVSEHFTTENYVATYSGSFSPVGYEAYWPSPSFIMRSNEFYHHPNRQRTTRVPNEMDRGPAVYGRAYGLCR
ncbi:hypothetical protein BC332_17716 [Capsicum chinense]|nr:hypothetical protein BC332_17716 [Capsicum chinense]